MTEFLPGGIFELTVFILAAAFLLDLAIGDPRWLPHPVRLMGWLCGQTERVLRPRLASPRQERIGGTVLVAVVLTATLALSWAVVGIALIPAGSGNPLISLAAVAFLVYLTATCLATRELVRCAGVVVGFLDEGKIQPARRELAMIVGRDTQNLSPRQIQKALIETLGENLSDGVVAPLFYLALGGIPLALTYKAINTMDSMVGYKNARYLHFGRTAARLDDLAGYLPARISAALIALAAGLISLSPAASAASWQTMRADGRKHASPNAGLPEAAMAGALGVCLGGGASYGGLWVEKPCLGTERTDDYGAAVRRAQEIVILSAFIGFLAASLLAAGRGAF